LNGVFEIGYKDEQSTHWGKLYFLHPNSQEEMDTGRSDKFILRLKKKKGDLQQKRWNRMGECSF